MSQSQQQYKEIYGVTKGDFNKACAWYIKEYDVYGKITNFAFMVEQWNEKIKLEKELKDLKNCTPDVPRTTRRRM